jgi:3-deoxy-D-manno-octulosonate 8-phosphate phosphatase (KDO 8-P phosphatase)
MNRDLIEKAKKIKLLLTDCDGVLTDGGVYYSESGEVMKRFNIRDGMGVERLRKMGIPTGIITGERSPSVVRRAEKLNIEELHLGVKDKPEKLRTILSRLALKKEEIAYIGDDVNDLEVMQMVGLTACPNDAISLVKPHVDYICEAKGGQGAFREFVELIIAARG